MDVLNLGEDTKQYFVKACQGRAKVDQEAIVGWWQRVCDRYSESQRYYHTMSHIVEMLQLLLTVCPEDKRESASVVLAVFFHDVIYDPQKKDNEERSADLFEEFARECLQEDDNFRQAVVDYILLTKTHTTPEHTTENMYGKSDSHYLLDLDMAVLGRDERGYDLYADQIRQEYCHIPKAAYCEGRAGVLRAFLKQKNIYATQLFRDRFEANARHNLQREIDRLDSERDHS